MATIMEVGSSGLVNLTEPGARRFEWWPEAVSVSAPGVGRADGTHVVTAHRAYVVHAQRAQCLGPAVHSHELDVERIGRIELNDRAEVAGVQSLFGDVAHHHDRVQFTERHAHGE